MNKLRKWRYTRKWTKAGYVQCFLCPISREERTERCKMIKKYNFKCWYPYKGE